MKTPERAEKYIQPAREFVEDRVTNIARFIVHNPEFTLAAIGVVMGLGKGKLYAHMIRRFQPELVQMTRDNFGWNRRTLSNIYSLAVLEERHPILYSAFWMSKGLIDGLSLAEETRKEIQSLK